MSMISVVPVGLTLGLPTFFYPAEYQGVENHTKAITDS